MAKKTKKILKFILIVIIIWIAIMIPKWRLDYREYKMNQMLMEKGIMSPEGDLLPPFPAE